MEGYLRPVDLAQAVWVSAQTVRKYEVWGFSPLAKSSATGQRRYTHRYLHAIDAARTMKAGYGWRSALGVMRAVHGGDLESALAVVDSRHAELNRGRRQLGGTLRALRTVTGPEETGAQVRRSGWLRVGQASRRVGVRVSALRFWEEEGLLHPHCDESSGLSWPGPAGISGHCARSLTEQTSLGVPLPRLAVTVIGKVSSGAERGPRLIFPVCPEVIRWHPLTGTLRLTRAPVVSSRASD